MQNSAPARKYLAISAVSLLGSCETKALDSMLGRQRVTSAMKVGTEGHERLAKAAPKISTPEIVRQISSGMATIVRELPIFDDRLKIVGRIDQLSMTGSIENGKNTGIIIDDKYPSSDDRIYGITLYQKIQLSSYAVGLSDSQTYGAICSIVDARVVYRDRGTDAVLKQFDMGKERLDACKANVPAAVEDAWGLYLNKKAPEHRRFDVESGEWVGCYCKADKVA
jgi:hypothetical protein